MCAIKYNGVCSSTPLHRVSVVDTIFFSRVYQCCVCIHCESCANPSKKAMSSEYRGRLCIYFREGSGESEWVRPSEKWVLEWLFFPSATRCISFFYTMIKTSSNLSPLFFQALHIFGQNAHTQCNRCCLDGPRRPTNLGVSSQLRREPVIMCELSIV